MIMTEQVTEEHVEPEEVILDDSGDEDEVSTQDNNEEEAFNPDSLEFDKPESAYDFTMFGDGDYGDFEATATGLELNQKQMEEFYKLSNPKEETTTQPTPASIKASLEEELTQSEKRAYSGTNNWVRSILKGSEHEGEAQAIMSNPSLVKIMTVIANSPQGSPMGKSPESKVEVPTITEDTFYDRIIAMTDEHGSNSDDYKDAKEKLKAELLAQSNGKELFAKVKDYL